MDAHQIGQGEWNDCSMQKVVLGDTLCHFYISGSSLCHSIVRVVGFTPKMIKVQTVDSKTQYVHKVSNNFIKVPA